jgi:small multidrug resistance pump
MDKEEMKKMGLTSIEDFITEDFGAEGTPERLEFEAGADAFILGEKLKEERKKAGLTQEQLAAKIRYKEKLYLSDREWSCRCTIVYIISCLFWFRKENIFLDILNDMKGWIFLIGAVIFEVLGTSMLKLSEQFSRLLPTAIAIIGYLLSLYLLSYALRTLPIAIAYGAWGAIGIVLITFIGVIFFKQVPDLPAIIGLFLIVSGVLIINLFSKMQIH